jgi:DNA-binding NtrC family response regulator
MNDTPHALIVEDEKSSRIALADIVRREGFSVDMADSLEQAHAAIAARAPSIILCDLLLPDGAGTELLGGEDTGYEVILVTGNASVESAVSALRLGAWDYLTKPIDIPRLKSLLAGFRRADDLKKEVTGLRDQLRTLGRFGRMVGVSDAMQKVYELIEKVAPTDASVMITGESGTGKELVAQTIHDLSRRRKRPFIPINCGAISPNLMESELFGHEKGAFTGASKSHRGYFESASGGTLFLDEITEMPADLQVKLLRVLESGRLNRVGGTDQIDVDVRIVAATNRNPETAVREGSLREDLYYRLRVFPITLPPLRGRRGDVETITRHFLHDLNEESGTGKTISAGTIAVLETHHWPGNVRELRNAVHQAFILAGDVIGPDHLPPEVRGDSSGGLGPSLQLRIGMSLAEAERQLIEATLESYGGDKKKTAEVLGVSVKTLYNRFKAWEKDEPAE